MSFYSSFKLPSSQSVHLILSQNANKNGFLLLLRKSEINCVESVESFFYIPSSIHFFEDCSIQLLIEKPNTQGVEYAAWLYYFNATRYPMSLEGLNNIFIIVRFLSSEFKSIRNADKAINLSMKLFFHFVYISSELPEQVDFNKNQAVFPNSIVCR